MIRNLVIEMDRDPNLYPDTNHVQWTADPRWSNYNILGAYVTPPSGTDTTTSGASSTSGSAPLDGFNITRTGDVPTSLRITIQINHVPERIKLSPHLANILGVQEDTRQNIFGSFWHYVKANGLQDKNDRRLIRLDEKLRSVFKFVFCVLSVPSYLLTQPS
jgi:SWI/SNF-related matrix-associated actin-dependent regulator of chromatin subfamily D